MGGRGFGCCRRAFHSGMTDVIRPGLLLLPLLAPAVATAAADTREVADAERAFAAMARDKGVGSAFKSFVADDGILFVPEPRPAKAFLESAFDAPGSLRWWPVYAGIALSGDLGFATGPFVSEAGERKGHGWFFTVWRRQPDGAWRWVLDHGIQTAEPAAIASDAPLAALPAGRRGGDGASGDLQAIEARLDRSLAGDAPRALQAILADDGRVMRHGAQPAIGRAAFSVALLRGPDRIRSTRLGGGMSEARDLAYSYGDAAWEAGGKSLKGHYVRLWQRRSGGWRLVVDELIPQPPVRPSSTAASPSPPPAATAAAASGP